MEILFKNKGKVPAYSWCNDLDPATMEQVAVLVNHPKAFHHIALMPDCHAGKGMPIGGVLATHGVVIPAAVGVDIGCGMLAVRTDIKVFNQQDANSIIDDLAELIPVGYKHQASPIASPIFDRAPKSKIVRSELHRAPAQLGTLGGGNHFIEVQLDIYGALWVMLHSGSRNFGWKIANEYIKKAKAFAMKMSDNRPPKDLEYLPVDSDIGQAYLEDMQYAMDFAEENRNQMLLKIREVLTKRFPNSTVEKTVNIHHNFAALENHFGEDVWVHRKGATEARVGKTGIIPGSMGTPSYIVTGNSNPDSFLSCSHGAGRTMGRKAFTRQHTLEECQEVLNKASVYMRGGWNDNGGKDLSESPEAYKDIDVVMASQMDLIEVLYKLQPLAVLKG